MKIEEAFINFAHEVFSKDDVNDEEFDEKLEAVLFHNWGFEKTSIEHACLATIYALVFRGEVSDEDAGAVLATVVRAMESGQSFKDFSVQFMKDYEEMCRRSFEEGWQSFEEGI